MFKTWSIKTQLHLILVSVVMFIVITIVLATFAQKELSTTETSLNQSLIPISNHNSALNETLASLIAHQKNVIASSNIQTIMKLRESRVELENKFETNWQKLDKQLKEYPEESAFIQSLYVDYRDLISLDNDLTELKLQNLDAWSKLIRHQQTMDDEFESLKRSLESISDDVFSEGNAKMIEAVGDLNRDLSSLEILIYQASNLSSGKSLLQIKQQKFIPFQNLIFGHLEKLTQTGFDVTTVKQNLKELFSDLTSKEGFFSIKGRVLETELLFAQTQQMVSEHIPDMLSRSGRFAQHINSRIHEAVQANVKTLKKTRWEIITFGLILLALILTFIIKLILNISASLQSFRTGMHALSEGEYTTRLEEKQTKNEVDLLAEDFNKVAKNTEKAINEYDQNQALIAQQENYLRTILNTVPEAILTLTPEGVIEGANPATENILEAKLEQLIGEDIRRFLANISVHWNIDKLMEKALEGFEFSGVTYRQNPISIYLSFSEMSVNEEKRLVCVISDVTDIKLTDEQLQRTTSELNAILDNALVGIALIRDRQLIRVNQKFEELFLYKREEVEGSSTEKLYKNTDAYQMFGQQAYESLSLGVSYEAQLEMKKSNGELFWCALSGKVIEMGNANAGSIWLFEDVTTQRENEENLIKLASVDTLTGLANRNVFHDRLEHALHKAERTGNRLAVFFLDMDNFKNINDSLGHRIGDLLLIEVARRLKSNLREGDTVARMGGDEFMVLLEDAADAQSVARVAHKVLEATNTPYMLEGTEVNVSPSVGISLYPADGRDVDMLIRNADAAMYHAKRNGRNNFQFYSSEMNAESAEKLAMETALRKAAEQNEFYLHYQPQINLKTQTLQGAEALLRWNSSQWGEVSPVKFVPILEDSGLIGKVGEWVLREACQTYVEMADLLPANFKVAVNLSSRQFKGGNLANQVQQILEDTGMTPSNLELEITESMLMDDTQLAVDTLNALNQKGISLAVDDFGTGYSSLAYLKQFPLDILKIDRSFVRDITTDVDDAAIVDAIMAMSRRLNLYVVAEGVETVEQLDFLKHHECDYAQGYYFSRPVDKEGLKAYINKPLPLS